jgi:hypothetical protein
MGDWIGRRVDRAYSEGAGSRCLLALASLGRLMESLT